MAIPFPRRLRAHRRGHAREIRVDHAGYRMGAVRGPAARPSRRGPQRGVDRDHVALSPHRATPGVVLVGHARPADRCARLHDELRTRRRDRDRDPRAHRRGPRLVRVRRHVLVSVDVREPAALRTRPPNARRAPRIPRRPAERRPATPRPRPHATSLEKTLGLSRSRRPRRLAPPGFSLLSTLYFLAFRGYGSCHSPCGTAGQTNENRAGGLMIRKLKTGSYR